MADRPRLPHDRGHLLWSSEDGPTRMLQASMDRWTQAVLGDDGIDMPYMGSRDNSEARIIARSEGIICGTAVVDYMLQIWSPDIRVRWRASDGKSVLNGDEIAELSGPEEAILLMERSILNILGYLSGISTEANKWARIAPKQVACTRKTVWGLLDKWAVHIGGGLTHRLNRTEAKMVKENDLAGFDGGTQIEKIANYLQSIDMTSFGAFLEIEVQEAKEAIVAASVWSQRKDEPDFQKLVIMLDNFGPEASAKAVEELETMSLREFVVLEASGGISFDSLDEWHECGLDVVSTSAINRGTSPLDLSMLMDE